MTRRVTDAMVGFDRAKFADALQKRMSSEVPPVSMGELSRQTGVPLSTISRAFYGVGTPLLENFLTLLEWGGWNIADFMLKFQPNEIREVVDIRRGYAERNTKRTV